MSDLKGKLWYSEKQRRICQEIAANPSRGVLPRGCLNLPWRPVYGRLLDGRIVEYTELKSGEYIDEPSSFDDAVCLGEGEYVGK